MMRGHRMDRRERCVLVAAALLLLAPVAPAEETGVRDVEKAGVAVEPAPVNLMAVTSPARLSGAAVTATTWAGYDGANGVPSVAASVEARLFRRLALAVGVESSSDEDGELNLRPQVALRLQFLDQSSNGIDATASASYRQDRFEVDGGFFQGTVALGRSFDRLQLVLNLTFGIDPEGDDLEGEVRAAGLVEVSPGIHLGVDGRYRHDLGSTDPNRAERDRPSAEALGGATAAYVHGRWAVMLEAGLALVTTTTTRTGPVALAGYSATF